MSDDQRYLVRDFPVELAEIGDGRTIEARVVPYDTPSRVADPPDFIPYEETFAQGAFERQLRAPERVRVWLNFEHEQGLRGIVGHGVQLREQPDGLYGTFRVHENADGDKALRMVNDGLLTGLSIEFRDLASRKRGDGVVERLRASVDRVALCRFPAFRGAEVLAVREQPEPEPDSDEPPAEPGDAPDEPSSPPEPEPEPVAVGMVEEALTRIGWEPLLRRAVVTRPWDGSAARFTDEQYARACLIDRGGDAPVKERCSLPVLEPNGDLNTNALGQAAGRLNQVSNVSPAMKAAAARKLMRYYGMAKMDAPASVRMMASR